jgi:hypothetical protein
MPLSKHEKQCQIFPGIFGASPRTAGLAVLSITVLNSSGQDLSYFDWLQVIRLEKQQLDGRSFANRTGKWLHKRNNIDSVTKVHDSAVCLSAGGSTARTCCTTRSPSPAHRVYETAYRCLTLTDIQVGIAHDLFDKQSLIEIKLMYLCKELCVKARVHN